MLSLLQYCSREFFLRIPITIRWATNTFMSSGLVSSQLFSHAQGFSSTPSLSNSIGSLSPLSFACLSFAWTYLLVFSLSIVHILSSKNSSKLHLECIYLNPCSFDILILILLDCLLHIKILKSHLQPLQQTLKFTKFTATGEAWNSMKNHFLSKCEQLTVATE